MVRLVLGALVLMLGARAAVLAAPDPQVSQGIPPAELRHGSGLATLTVSTVKWAALRFDTEAKWVELRWRYSAAGDYADPDAYAVQRLAVGFWPTYVEPVGPNLLLVAGKERDGATRIERWLVTPPLVVQPAGGGAPSLQLKPLADVTPVYDAATVGKDMVRTMFRLRGRDGYALVQFHDSRDLYELDWQAEPFGLNLVLSAVQEPGLAYPGFDEFAAGDHAAHGYVYSFSSQPDDFTNVPILMLVDGNRDGYFTGASDSHGLLTWSQFDAAGYTDGTQYLEYEGRTPY